MSSLWKRCIFEKVGFSRIEFGVLGVLRIIHCYLKYFYEIQCNLLYNWTHLKLDFCKFLKISKTWNLMCISGRRCCYRCCYRWGPSGRRSGRRCCYRCCGRCMFSMTIYIYIYIYTYILYNWWESYLFPSIIWFVRLIIYLLRRYDFSFEHMTFPNKIN